MDINDLDRIVRFARDEGAKGEVATYIPELSKADGSMVGACVMGIDGNFVGSGEYEELFTIQSVSKAIVFMKVLEDNPIAKVKEKISFLPTTEGFNSIFQLETKNSNRPLNPFINAGAIAAISMLSGSTKDEKFDGFMDFCKRATNNYSLRVNERVFASESLTGDRNRALAYFMKGTGILEGSVEDLLEIYFKICSIEVCCKDIAHVGACLANEGRLPFTDERLVSSSTARIVKSVMTTCGLYEESGDFAVNVGIPGKSGVGGGIMGCIPYKCGVGVMGPALNEHGNSKAGVFVLMELSKIYNWSIF